MNKQRTKHAVDVTVRKKKNKSAPARTAPITLVAANSTASRTIDNKTVPRIPTSSAVIIVHKLPQQTLRKSAALMSVTARYTTATPRITHKNAGVRVIVAVILRNAVIMPIIRLATIAITVQPGLQLLHDVDIKIHLPLYSM